MAAKVKHLLNRDGRYWARMGVPEGLRRSIGKTELLTALGADRRAALRLLPAAIANMQAQLEQARAMVGPRPSRALPRFESYAGLRNSRILRSKVQCRNRAVSWNRTSSAARSRPLYPWQVAREHYANELQLDDANRSTGPALLGYDPATHARLFRDGYRQALVKIAAGHATTEESQAGIGWAIDAFAERGNTSVEPGSPEWRQLARTLAGIQIEILQRQTERDAGKN